MYLKFFLATIVLAINAVNILATIVPRVPPAIDQFLDAHNVERSKHGAVALTWNTTLADQAQATADLCLNEHTNSGQNLALGFSTAYVYVYTIDEAVAAWNSEIAYYDPVTFMSNTTGMAVGHWTQVVWKSTNTLGCAFALCPPGSAGLDTEWQTIWYFVCNYYPPGNVVPAATYYPLNVQP